MNKLLFTIFGLVLMSVAQAQSFNPGIPMPGLPKSLGQKTMANSTSVTMASNQTPISITGNITATNPSVSTNGTAAPTSSTQIGGVDQAGNLTPLVIGAQGITVSANQSTSPWVVSVPAGVGVTNTPTVNQGTSPWVVFQPTGVGITNTVTVNQGTTPWVTSSSGGGSGVAITNTPSVVIPGGVAITNTPTVNQGTSPWVVSSTASTVATSTITRVANSASSQSLLASNASRKQVFLFNDAATANCYVKFGATASVTDFTIKLFATDTYIMDPPVYTGAIDYICDAASGSMEVNEQ
jgi:hypothetical protein